MRQQCYNNKHKIIHYLKLNNLKLSVLDTSGVFLIEITNLQSPANLQGEAVSPNAIQLTWDPPEDSGESIQSYELYYNDSHFRQNVRIIISPPRNTYLLEDLTPNTVHQIWVTAKFVGGEGPPTKTILIRTFDYGNVQLIHLF